jgi:hypothetical protein
MSASMSVASPGPLFWSMTSSVASSPASTSAGKNWKPSTIMSAASVGVNDTRSSAIASRPPV